MGQRAIAVRNHQYRWYVCVGNAKYTIVTSTAIDLQSNKTSVDTKFGDMFCSV